MMKNHYTSQTGSTPFHETNDVTSIGPSKQFGRGRRRGPGFGYGHRRDFGQGRNHHKSSNFK